VIIVIALLQALTMEQINRRYFISDSRLH